MPFDIETENAMEYRFYPVKGKGIGFQVKAPNDAHISLTTGPFEGNPMYEIFIGGWNNAKCGLRKNREKPELALVDRPEALSAAEFRGFWITWQNNTVILGSKDDPLNPIISWTEPEPFDITHFGVRTAWGASGAWIIDDEWDGYEVNLNRIGGAADAGTPVAPMNNGPGQWVPASGGVVPPNAVVGGFDNEEMFVARASHQGALLPGKLLPSHGVCYISWGGLEVSVPDYEVLCNCQAEWVPATDGHIPDGAFAAGTSEDGETLYVGRVNHNDTHTVGKVHCSHKSCYIPYGGDEIGFTEYEVLVTK